MPGWCAEGATITFWLKILGPVINPTNNNTLTQGIITTRTTNAPGIQLSWTSGGKLEFRLYADTPGWNRNCRLNQVHYLTDYGYGNWVHITLHYLARNNMHFYLNGAWHSEQYLVGTYKSSIAAFTDGYLEIGHQTIGSDSDIANIMFDELMIWQRALNSDEIENLYGSYTL